MSKRDEFDTREISSHSTHTAIDLGRGALSRWLATQPDDFYSSDPHMARVLRRLGGPAWLDSMSGRLAELGRQAAGPLDRACEVNNRPHNLPRLERFDPIGRRIETVEHHPTYHDAGRIIYGSGMLGELISQGGFLRAISLFVLTSMCGEAGHNCPVACTAGVIRALSTLGDRELVDAYLPGLVSRDYDVRLDGAQFLTEIQGGSDVGANATVARQADDGTWRIRGEKWFCSNANAALILMTARFESTRAGTAGLGLFLVPRVLNDGSLNNFSIRRLKDKLGTRSMASGEIDFENAFAWSLGPVEQGFKNMLQHVINISRLYNCAAVAGAARRAWVVARGYTMHRHAFGRPIADYSLVREALAELFVDTTAIMTASLELARYYDDVDAESLDNDGRTFVRLAVNVGKSLTAEVAVKSTLRAIELLGGNGAIESFSVLPRLHRDMIVCENWEGTHNTLVAQTLRDVRRFSPHVAYLAHLAARAERVDGLGAAEGVRIATSCAVLRKDIDAAAALDDDRATLRMRRHVRELGRLWFCVTMLEQAAADGDEQLVDAVRFMFNRDLDRFGAFEVDEIELINRLA
jgi:alkylation response protein AidB-like acyl-CoA dehydrogenase